MATKLGRSPVTRLASAAAADGGDISSTAIECQRYADEKGAVQITFSADPVGTGEILIEGRLAPGNAWGVVNDSSTDAALDIANFSATVLSVLIPDVTICPQMRVSTSNTAAIGVGVTITVDIQE